MTASDTKFIQQPISNYQKGIDIQREAFKMCKHDNNYDGMCDSIENIKSDIKQRSINKGRDVQIKRIERIVHWYRTKEQHSMVKTQDGWVLSFSPGLTYLVNKNLTVAYELILQELEVLGLL